MSADGQQTSDSDMAGIFDDAAFNSLNNYESYSSADSPFDASKFFNLDPDSPDYRQARTPSKSFLDQDTPSVPQHLLQHPRSVISSRSAESSSQDSSSETSVRRKRKTTSESPPTENLASLKMDSNTMLPMDMENLQNMQEYARANGLDQDMIGGNMDMAAAFDFDSAASSPGVLDAGLGTFHSGHAAMKNNMLQSGPLVSNSDCISLFMHY